MGTISSYTCDSGKHPASMTATLFVPGLKPVGTGAFLAFWEELYTYPRESLYTDNIGKPLTPERVRELYVWKNGGELSTSKRKSVESNFVERIGEVTALPNDTSPAEFLNRFDQGGAIWRIYWLHLWRPDRYPIYDQHVHRAMELIETGSFHEIPMSDPAKVSSYLERFLPFVRANFEGFDARRVDRALWACGKNMKQFRNGSLPSCP